jgi:exopolysaccharide biosynthesis WecB/TagA/CpsF family protein
LTTIKSSERVCPIVGGMASPAWRVTTHRIFGVDVLSCDRDRACDMIEARLADQLPTRVAFLNANLSLLSLERPDLERALHDFVVFNDGIGIEIANRILNHSPFQANLNGTDFIPYLLGRFHKPLRVFLLGSKPETVRKAAQTIRLRWPQHTIVGYADGYFSSDQEPSILRSIRNLRPDILLVAMGNPRQELWIARNIPQCAPCALGVGALFDFIAGEVRRAPRWVRAVRLEWLFRLALEPGRLWQRYMIGGAKFLGRVIAFRLAGLRARPIDVLVSAAGRPPVDDRSGWDWDLPEVDPTDVQPPLETISCSNGEPSASPDPVEPCHAALAGRSSSQSSIPERAAAGLK